MYICIYIHVSMYILIYIYILVYSYVLVCVCVCASPATSMFKSSGVTAERACQHTASASVFELLNQ